MQYLPILTSFTEDTLPDITTVALGALELFQSAIVPTVDFISASTLVVGSGNALCAGRIISHDKAFYADETNYQEMFINKKEYVDKVVLISASGGKHSVEIAKFFSDKNIPLYLYTNNEKALASEYIPKENIVVFPKNREPYTYNVSTYLGMILSETKENPETLLVDTQSALSRLPNNLASYDAYFFLLPPSFRLIAPMLLTKFDELFGSKVTARVYTIEEAKHAKTLIPNEKELFISIGVPTNPFNGDAIVVPMQALADYGAYMSVAYAIIGAIQVAHPQYFKDNVAQYVKEASKLFGQDIPIIVT